MTTLVTQPLQTQQIPKWIPIVILLLALIGFADATYLTVKHFQGVIPPCSIGGCENVLSSVYSEVAGIPVSLFGVIFYFLIALSLVVYFDSKKEIFLKIPIILSIGGFVGSLYFIFIMALVLKAFCLYCAISATTSICIFGFSSFMVYKNYERPI